MNSILRISFFIFLLHDGYGAIYNLNASEFDRMPPIYKLDDYNSCLQKPSDVYCTVIFKLVSDEPSELLHMIEEYSEHSKTHFDHTKLRYGVCVTQNCQHYIQDNTSVSETALERCLNETFWKDYQLKTKIQRSYCYNLLDNKNNIDSSDLVAGVILSLIIALAILGSLYDIYTSNKPEEKHFLLSFSLQRNWKKLTSTKPSSEPRLRKLKGLNGIKCLGNFLVIAVHSGFAYFVMGKNIHDIELAYYNLGFHLVTNGPIMIQVYFVISAFLLIYNMQLYAEKHPVNWRTVFKGILIRYIRLTPPYALMILLSATWFKFIGPGPIWDVTGKLQLTDCNNRWWMNLIYVNNYVSNFQCFTQCWYLAADFQLFCCSLIVYVLLRNSKFKTTILMSLIVFGSVIVAVHTYVRDLDHNPIFSPNNANELLAGDRTLNEVYRMGHGNISSYTIGMAFGYLVYRWQKEEKKFKKYPLLNYVYWVIGVIFFGVVISGAYFYRDGPRAPLYLRVLYAALAKPIVGVLIAIEIAAMFFKVDNFYRKMLEMNLWIIPSRLTYSAYLVHFTVLNIYLNIKPEFFLFTTFNVIRHVFYSIGASFITAIPLFLLVESPCMELIKYFITPTRKEAVVVNDKIEAVDGHKEAVVVNGHMKVD